MEVRSAIQQTGKQTPIKALRLAGSSPRIAHGAGSQNCLFHWVKRETDNRHFRLAADPADRPNGTGLRTYEPSLAVVVPGRERADLGGTTFLDELRYLLTSFDLPVIRSVIEASEEVPYLCFVLKLDMPVVQELLSREEIRFAELATDLIDGLGGP